MATSRLHCEKFHNVYHMGCGWCESRYLKSKLSKTEGHLSTALSLTVKQRARLTETKEIEMPESRGAYNEIRAMRGDMHEIRLAIKDIAKSLSTLAATQQVLAENTPQAIAQQAERELYRD